MFKIACILQFRFSCSVSKAQLGAFVAFDDDLASIISFELVLLFNSNEIKQRRIDTAYIIYHPASCAEYEKEFNSCVKKITTVPGDLETFNTTINMYDYHTRQPMTLNCMIHMKECKDQKHTPIYFELSPKPFLHPVWKKMNQIGDSFECKK